MSQTFAVLSDVHGNLEALQAVLAEIDRLGVGRILSLGDAVGYGPDPVECLQLVLARCDVRLMGNHERAAAYPELYFTENLIAREAMDWTRVRLGEAGLLQACRGLPASHREDRYLFVHGSARNPVDEYVVESDDRGYSTFDAVVESLDKDFAGFNVCFVGHNHKPFLATAEGFLHPHDQQSEFVLAGEKLYVSVGSVGQPRDRDPRACFCTFDGARLRYHRVSYDHATTARKILERGLPERLGARLARGT